MEKQIEELMERREEISFELVEADSSTYEELQEELQRIEEELEIMTGQSIDELDDSFYGDH